MKQIINHTIKQMIIILFISITLFTLIGCGSDGITDFESCIASGYPPMESYPMQCRTPDGRVFIQEIEPPLPPMDGR